jgi:hypothetical protein
LSASVSISFISHQPHEKEKSVNVMEEKDGGKKSEMEKEEERRAPKCKWEEIVKSKFYSRL